MCGLLRMDATNDSIARDAVPRSTSRCRSTSVATGVADATSAICPRTRWSPPPPSVTKKATSLEPARVVRQERSDGGRQAPAPYGRTDDDQVVAGRIATNGFDGDPPTHRRIERAPRISAETQTTAGFLYGLDVAAETIGDGLGDTTGGSGTRKIDDECAHARCATHLECQRGRAPDVTFAPGTTEGPPRLRAGGVRGSPSLV
jgi:hypothetical protein